MADHMGKTLFTKELMALRGLGVKLDMEKTPGGGVKKRHQGRPVLTLESDKGLEGQKTLVPQQTRDDSGSD